MKISEGNSGASIRFILCLFLGLISISVVSCKSVIESPFPNETSTFTPSPTKTLRKATPSITPSITPTRTSTTTPTPTFIPITPVLAGTHLPQTAGAITPQNAHRLTLQARWGKGIAPSAKYTPDGTRLVVGTSTGIFIYDAKTYSQINYIDTKSATFHIAISLDSQMLAAATYDNVFLYNLEHSQLINTIEAEAKGLSFHPDGTILAISSLNPWIQLWDLADVTLLRTIKDVHTWEPQFSPDGNLIVFAGYSTQIYNLEGDLLYEHNKPIIADVTQSISLSPDGKLLAEGSFYTLSILRVLDNGRLMSWRQIRVDGPPGVSSVAISPDGKTLAASIWDGAYLWRIDTARLVHKLDSQNTHTQKISWSPDSKNLAVSSENKGVEIFDAASGALLHAMNEFRDKIIAIDWSHPAQIIASGYFGRVDIVLNAQDGKVQGTLPQDSTFPGIQVWQKHHESIVSSWGNASILDEFALSPNGEHFAVTNTRSKTIPIHNTSDGTLVQTLIFDSNILDIRTFNYSPDGNYLATLTKDYSKRDYVEIVRVFRLSDGKIIYKIETANLKDRKGFTHEPNALAWSPDSSLIAVGAPDGTVHILDAKDEALLKNLYGHTMWVTDVAFSPDGRMLASASIDGTIRLWGVK
ncbi:hypothetical protein ACFLZW_00955 [Chloroflexota bacterium]